MEGPDLELDEFREEEDEVADVGRREVDFGERHENIHFVFEKELLVHSSPRSQLLRFFLVLDHKHVLEKKSLEIGEHLRSLFESVAVPPLLS